MRGKAMLWGTALIGFLLVLAVGSRTSVAVELKDPTKPHPGGQSTACPRSTTHRSGRVRKAGVDRHRTGSGRGGKPMQKLTVKRRMYMPMIALIAAVLLSSGLGSPVAAFNVFDETKWRDSNFFRIQEANGGKLLSGLARKGGPFVENNRLRFADPASITTIEATVTLLDIRVPGGTATTANRPRASLDGFFYWDGTGTGSATDQTGHVQGSVGLAADATQGNTVAQFFVFKCTNPGCTTGISLVPITHLGPIELFEPHRLKLQYDGTNFIFQLDDNPPVVFTPPDATRLPPTVLFKELRTRINIQDDPNAISAVTAIFDDVAVNGAPYDDLDDISLPKVMVQPASGIFPNTQTFDAVIAVVTDGEAVTNVKVTADGNDISGVLANAIPGTISNDVGGVTFRFPGVVLGDLLPPDTPVVIGVEATTASGATARGFALWRVVEITE